MKQALANIHPDAKIGENVIIEPFATIAADVTIGEGTWIGAGVVLMDGARIGKNCKIYPYAIIAGVPQDLKFKGETTTAEIGDNTTIREFATISRGTDEKFRTIIGSHCLVMAYVHVAHDCIVGNNCILVNNVQLAGHVEVDDWAIVGGVSAVHQFVRIGKHAMVPGGSLVRQDIPPYSTTTKDMMYGGINTIGLRRRGYSNDQIGIIQETYRCIYQRGMNTTQAVKYIEREMAITHEVAEILNFIKKSDRGIVKGVRNTTSQTEE